MKTQLVLDSDIHNKEEFAPYGSPLLSDDDTNTDDDDTDNDDDVDLGEDEDDDMDDYEDDGVDELES